MISAGWRGALGGAIGGVGTGLGKTLNLPGLSHLTSKTSGAITGASANVAASLWLN